MMRYAGANSILQATDWVQSFTNVGLGIVDLAGALPAKDNIEGIVEYLKNPKTMMEK